MIVDHVPLLSQKRGCFDGNHQKRHTRRRLRGQIHCQKVSFTSRSGAQSELFFFFTESFNCCCFWPSPLGATGDSMVTIFGRRSISSIPWSPPIRRPSSLTWRALTASCLCLSLTDPRLHRRRASSKTYTEASPVILTPWSLLWVGQLVVHQVETHSALHHLASSVQFAHCLHIPRGTC